MDDKLKKEISKKLSSDRDRKDKDKLTDEQLLEQLYRIRDGSAEWLEQCVIYGKKDGIKEAQALLDHAILNINKLNVKKKREGQK